MDCHLIPLVLGNNQNIGVVTHNKIVKTIPITVETNIVVARALPLERMFVNCEIDCPGCEIELFTAKIFSTKT